MSMFVEKVAFFKVRSTPYPSSFLSAVAFFSRLSILPTRSALRASRCRGLGARAAAINLLEADAEALAALALFLGDSPAEVDLEKLHKARLTATA